MAKKVFLVMRALPWHVLDVAIGKTPEGEVHSVKAAGDEKNAGFLPVFWTRGAAEEAYPDVEIKEAEVGDHWGDTDVPQDAQAPAIESMDREGLLDLIETTESSLSEDHVIKARELTLSGKKPSSRFGDKRLRNYLTALSLSS